jgi:N-acetylmuramoyl-L-alanine amidase
VIRSSLAHDFRLSPNVEARRVTDLDILLLHYTGMESAEKACEWLCQPQSKVSCHYLVDEEGRITQMIDEDLRGWHAGISTWRGVHDINSASIGIEIQNPGHALGYVDFPQVQMEAVIALCVDILSRHPIPPRNVLAHSDVAPMRKIDPGEKFGWGLLHARGIGHWLPPASDEGMPELNLGDSGAEVAALQLALQTYGYGMETDGQFDKKTQAVVSAFQRHFRPARVDGVADASTRTTLMGLLAAL